MGSDPIFRIRDVGAYLGVTHQRVTQMCAEGKLLEPEQVDGIGPMWKQSTIRAGPSVCGGNPGMFGALVSGGAATICARR
jgi:hypothetical protein